MRLAATTTLAAAPVNSAVIGASSSSVTLSWSPNGNPAGTSYEISYSSVDAFLTGWAVSTAPLTEATSLTAGGLSGGAAYYFRARAYNGNRIATAFDLTQSTQTLPVLSTPTLSAVALSSEAPSSGSWSPAIYAAGQLRLYSSTSPSPAAVLAAGTTFWTEAGLTRNTAVTCQVVAFNGAGIDVRDRHAPHLGHSPDDPGGPVRCLLDHYFFPERQWRSGDGQ